MPTETCPQCREQTLVTYDQDSPGGQTTLLVTNCTNCEYYCTEDLNEEETV